MNQQPHVQRDQHHANASQGKDHLNFAHKISLFKLAAANPCPGRGAVGNAAGDLPAPAAFSFVEDVFDFSRIPAAPRLRLVISNSLSVKA